MPIESQVEPPLLLDTAATAVLDTLGPIAALDCWPLPDVESPPAPPLPVSMGSDEHDAKAPTEATTAVHIHHFMILSSYHLTISISLANAAPVAQRKTRRRICEVS
jgi:hypothetical protein